MVGPRCFGKLATQQQHLVVEHLEAFHLHGGAWETVKNRAVTKLRLEQLVKEQPQYLLVADHSSTSLDRLGFRGIQQLTDYYRRRRNPADFANEGGVRSLS